MVPRTHEQWQALDFKRLFAGRAAFLNMDAQNSEAGLRSDQKQMAGATA